MVVMEGDQLGKRVGLLRGRHVFGRRVSLVVALCNVRQKENMRRSVGCGDRGEREGFGGWRGV